MSILKSVFTNCAHPKGRMGRAMLKFMNLCHAPLTNWGLKLVDIQDGWTMLDIGCGDCSSYSDTFVGGIGELYNGIKDSGAKFIGSVETDGYTFDDSEAVIDGKFIGLPLDDINEDDKTDTRIEAWLAQIAPDM